MKMLLPVASVLFLSPFVAASFQDQEEAQDSRGGSSLESRVAKLEEELAAEKKRHEEARALLDQTIVYLDAQAKGATALLGILDQSEQLGFTAGINPQSREVLLAGLRAYWGEKPKGLPQPPKEPPKAAAPAQAKPKPGEKRS